MRKKILYLFQTVFLLFITGILFAEPETVILNRDGYQFYSHTDYLEDANNWARYAPQNLFDGKADTSWAVGDGGPGTVIYISIPMDARTIKIINGYATNSDLFARNNRVKTIKTELCTGYSHLSVYRATELGQLYDVDRLGNEKIFVLEDTIKQQTLSLGTDYWHKTEALVEESKIRFDKQLPRMDAGEREGFKKGLIFLYLLRIEIVDVYKGSSWNDTCLSELAFEYETRSIPDKKGIAGFWETVRGADYEEIDFHEDGYVFAYSGARPFGSGKWAIEEGSLRITWDYGQERLYFFFYREGTRLTLLGTDGSVLVLEEMGFGG